MRVLLKDDDGCLRVVTAICVEFDRELQVCRVVLERNLFYVVGPVTQSDYDVIVGELYENGFFSLAGYECEVCL